MFSKTPNEGLAMVSEAGTELHTEEYNWAGNLRYAAAEVREPATLQELQDLVAGASRLRALGSRHSSTASPIPPASSSRWSTSRPPSTWTQPP
jgi:xylitol oxidase